MQESLTRIQARIIDHLRSRGDRAAPPPTYRELCEEFGWSSTATARDHLKALARKGVIDLPRGRARTVRLRETLAPVSRVPLYGRIRAGRPEMADQSIEGYVPVPADWAAGSDCFAVHVAGDSMEDVGVLDGDVVIVRRQDGRDGDLVAALLDGATTLKRLRLRGGRVTLIAHNPAYTPIEIQSESSVIQGVVVGLLRRYAPANQRKGRV